MSRELPILFNTDMVRAILDGRKTVTRRLIKQQQLVGFLPDKCKNGTPEEFLKEKKYMFKPYCDMTDTELINTSYNQPYQPGDILYVRETWCLRYDGEKYFYKADKHTPREEKRLIDYDHVSWKPSIHMPKEAARIFLKVTNVRVERLDEVTIEDCEKEGVFCGHNGDIFAFISLWNSTIKKSDIDRYGWNANPWVWVIEFERCEKPKVT